MGHDASRPGAGSYSDRDSVGSFRFIDLVFWQITVFRQTPRRHYGSKRQFFFLRPGRHNDFDQYFPVHHSYNNFEFKEVTWKITEFLR